VQADRENETASRERGVSTWVKITYPLPKKQVGQTSLKNLGPCGAREAGQEKTVAEVRGRLRI